MIGETFSALGLQLPAGYKELDERSLDIGKVVACLRSLYLRVWEQGETQCRKARNNYMNGDSFVFSNSVTTCTGKASHSSQVPHSSGCAGGVFRNRRPSGNANSASKAPVDMPGPVMAAGAQLERGLTPLKLPDGRLLDPPVLIDLALNWLLNTFDRQVHFGANNWCFFAANEVAKWRSFP
ncbi:hypothetical protein Ciccas_014459 [Cichlidogyrus casuarinus]|uniref:Uncharacterized protein n=1 Tax=Cichlidogyrus casuarinus TaxID=1844966 RepID=A0ABD2PMU1_9PLAT